MKRLARFICVLLVAIFATGFSACSSADVDPWEGDKFVDDSYVIEEISAEYTVNENSVIEVTERITVNFLQFHRGIYRDLPVNSGERYRNIKTDRATSPYFSLERYDGIIRIGLGLSDDDRPVLGEQEYTLSYEMILPERENMNEFYLNLVGFGFDTEIERAKVTLNLPERIENAKFYTDYGSNNLTNKAVLAEIDGKEGYYSYYVTISDLSPYSGLTVYSNFVGGYELKDYADAPVATIILGIIFVAAAALLLFKAGQNQTVTPISNFYPPKDEFGREMTPPELGLYIDGRMDNRDLTSIIFYWASKGYLNITDVESDDPVLLKVKDLDGEQFSPQYIALFNKIFALGSEVRLSSVSYQLSGQFASVIASEKSKMDGFYEKKPGKTAVISAVAAAALTLIFLIIRGFSVAFCIDSVMELVLSAAPAFLIALFAAFVSRFIWERRYKMKFSYKAASILACCGYVVWNVWFSTFIYSDAVNVIESIFLFAPLTALAYACGSSGKRSPKYLKLLGEITGFKHFLEVAEKNELEMLLSENPQYYYDILPYANVLGVSDIWSDKFKDMTLEPPTYVRGVDVFDYLVFRQVYRSVGVRMMSAASPPPSSSSRSGGGRGGFGGGFGGGGFGGGGFGGGGGGAR